MFKNIFSFSSEQPASSKVLKTLTPEMLTFLTQLPTPVLLLKSSGRIEFANEAAASLLQRKTKELLGLNISKLGITSARLREMVEDKKASKQVLEIADPQANALLVSASARPLGETSLIMLTMEEIPQVRELEQEKNFLQSVLGGYLTAVTVHDLEGNCVLWNKKAQELFGPTPQQAQGKALYQLLPTMLIPSLRQLDEEVRQGKTPVEADRLAYKTADDKDYMLRVAKTALKDENKKTQFILTVYEEITKHYEWERDLQHSQRLLEAILNNIPLGVYTRDCDAKMTFFNKRSLQVLNESDSYQVDHPNAYQGNEVIGYQNREKQILQQGKTYEYPEEEYVDSAGKKKIIHMIKVPLMDAGPKPLVLTIVEDVTKRRQQEQEIKRVNSFLTAIVQNAPIALYARAESGRMLLRNKQCDILFGAAREEDFDERSRLPHETDEQVTRYLGREHDILEKGETLDIPEEEYITPNGDTKLLHMVKAPVSGDTPESRCVITLVEDITARKAQERALVDSKNFLQTVIDQLPVSLSVKNYAGQYILWNKKSEELFGVTANEVIGQNAYRPDLNKDQAEFVRENDLRVFESGKEQDIPRELVSSASDGIKIMHTVKTPVFNVDGTPNCLLVVSEDITAKTKMEKQILEASDKNTLLVENAREGIVIIEDGAIIYANHAFCALLGYDTLEDIKGKKILDFSTENHLVFLKEKYEAVLAGAAGSEDAMEAHFVRKDGSTVEARFAAVLAKYLGRRIMLGFASDVTATNRTLRELKNERDSFRQIFEDGTVPAFLLASNGYISVMNEACRKLFDFTEKDKKFYRNVYIRPAFSLAVRKLMREGLPAQMDYVFDFDKAAARFPQWIRGTGKQLFAVTLAPISKRDTKDGSVEADYLVSLQPKEETIKPLPPVVTEPANLKEAETKQEDAATTDEKSSSEEQEVISLPPLPPFLTPGRRPLEGQPVWLLPNSEPYALCDEDFMILTCNELFCSLCGLKEDELLGQDIRRIFVSDEKPLVDQDFALLAKDGKLSNREYTISLGSSLETCKVRLLAEKEANGNFLFVLHSLAFHLQIMKILEERSAQLSALRYAVDGGVLRVEWKDKRLGRITQLNNWLSVKTGYQHEELAQKSLSDLFLNPAQEEVTIDGVLQKAQEALLEQGKSSFHLPLRRKDGSCFEAQVVLTSLDIPQEQEILAVISDLTAQQDALSKDSREAQELAGLRQTLPGLYLKMDGKGKVLEVFSNLPYLENTQAQKMFLGKAPEAFWPAEAASQVLFTIKEALSVRVSSQVGFEWEMQGEKRYYEAAVLPLKRRREVVLWVKDSTEKRIYDAQIHELYRLSQETQLTLTQQVEKLLALGKRIFKADIGLVLRFEHTDNQVDSAVLYTTPNSLRLERQMEFAVDECLRDVVDGSTVLWADLSNLSCNNCIHKVKKLGSLVAAPLFVEGKVQGALCFAARTARRNFAPGAEEVLGLMARMLGLRIELRETGKMLGDTTRLFTRTLEQVQSPACTVDPDLQITSVNEAFVKLTGQRKSNLLGKDLFAEMIRRPEAARRDFRSTADHCTSDISFRMKLDIFQTDGICRGIIWEVFICKNAEGKVEGYALIGQMVK